MEAKVVRITQSTTFSPPGGARPVYRVDFMVGEQGPFVVDIPGDQFTPERVQQELDKVAKTVRALPYVSS